MMNTQYLQQRRKQDVAMKKIRILVVEDQHVVREGLVAILSFQSDIEVVGEAPDGIQAVEIARKTRPDVILLDMVMPKQDGLITIPKLKLAVPEARILVLSSFAESDRVYQAIKAGALGYMLKDTTRVQLLQAIRDVATGQAQLQPSIAMKVIHEFDRAVRRRRHEPDADAPRTRGLAADRPRPEQPGDRQQPGRPRADDRQVRQQHPEQVARVEPDAGSALRDPGRPGSGRRLGTCGGPAGRELPK